MSPIPNIIHGCVRHRTANCTERWSTWIWVGLGLLLLSSVGCRRVASTTPQFDGTGFPKKPIKIIVYTQPGGPIDVTAQRFADLAQQHSGKIFVVEYKQGAGGILAMEHVLQSRADGYTVLACTKSNIAKMVSAGREDYIDKLDWLALLMTDPECVISRRDSPVANWSEFIRNVDQLKTEQVWGGPARGGLDHITAMQIWDRFKIPARWIPYASGDLALQGLLAGEISAYVGNPGDVRAQPELVASVLSSPQRLPQFPDTPTFAEFGAPELDDLSIWRGFAVRKSCPPAVLDWYDKLFQTITSDPAWRSTWQRDGIRVEYLDETQFRQVAVANRDELRQYLERLDMLPAIQANIAGGELAEKGLVVFLLIVGLHIGIAAALAWTGRWEQYGQTIILTLLLSVCALMFWETTQFPTAERAKAAAVPRLWMALISAMCLAIAIRRPTLTAEVPQTSAIGVRRVAVLGVLLVTYVISAVYLGYFLGTAIFLVTVMLLLGERRWYVMFGVTAAWLIFAYLTFSRLLYVPLPTERWLNALF